MIERSHAVEWGCSKSFKFRIRGLFWQRCSVITCSARAAPQSILQASQHLPSGQALVQCQGPDLKHPVEATSKALMCTQMKISETSCADDHLQY